MLKFRWAGRSRADSPPGAVRSGLAREWAPFLDHRLEDQTDRIQFVPRRALYSMVSPINPTGSVAVMWRDSGLRASAPGAE